MEWIMTESRKGNAYESVLDLVQLDSRFFSPSYYYETILLLPRFYSICSLLLKLVEPLSPSYNQRTGSKGVSLLEL